MTLPSELRLQIYDHVLAPLTARTLLKDPQLLLVSRQLRSELLKPFLRAISAEQKRLEQQSRDIAARIKTLDTSLDANMTRCLELSVMCQGLNCDSSALSIKVRKLEMAEEWREIRMEEKRHKNALNALGGL